LTAGLPRAYPPDGQPWLDELMRLSLENETRDFAMEYVTVAACEVARVATIWPGLDAAMPARRRRRSVHVLP